ncbi:DNA alkylation repair protein [Pollutibacter soli]|uniref:DNA alkylation repair protein n=1 Tax=Pollutibacter soli TaxID=3034157 RepID=UPI0030136B70
MHPYLLSAENAFSKKTNPANAAAAKAYLRNQFDFFGLKTDLRREITKSLFKKELPGAEEIPNILRQAWEHPMREMQYFAIELAACYKKEWPEEMIVHFEKMILGKSWWDSVDAIASQLTGPYFKRYPEQVIPVTSVWNKSGDIWLQRSSLIFQLLYKKETDTTLLKKYILQLRKSDEFFVQKAIGWVLRQYARTNPEWVKMFVEQTQLPALSRREALKHF